MNATVIATGSYLPARIVTNDELAARFATSDSWIREKIGIQERRYAEANEGVSDMAVKAAHAALSDAGLKASDIDAIVFATATPDYHAPGSGALLQYKLGCRDIPAFDVRNTSPGFLFSLDLADGLIKSGRYKTVLVVGAEVHSTALDFSDKGRMMSVIFGDGCGCFILRASDTTRGLCDFILHTDGTHAKSLWCEGPSSLRNPRVSADQIADGVFFPRMDGRVVFEHAVKDMTAAVTELLERNNLIVPDVDWILTHQANLRIIETIRDALGVATERMPHNIEVYGNTSSASIPILADELKRSGKILPGQTIVLTSFGAGFCWGAGLWRV